MMLLVASNDCKVGTSSTTARKDTQSADACQSVPHRCTHWRRPRTVWTFSLLHQVWREWTADVPFRSPIQIVLRDGVQLAVTLPTTNDRTLCIWTHTVNCVYFELYTLTVGNALHYDKSLRETFPVDRPTYLLFLLNYVGSYIFAVVGLYVV